LPGARACDRSTINAPAAAAVSVNDRVARLLVPKAFPIMTHWLSMLSHPDLLKLTLAGKPPGYPQSRTAAKALCLTENGWPPPHEVLGFVPVRMVRPPALEREYDQPGRSKRLALEIVLSEAILRNDRPSAFRREGAYPLRVFGIRGKAVLKVDDLFDAQLATAQFTHCVSEIRWKVIVEKEVQAARRCSKRIAASKAPGGIS